MASKQQQRRQQRIDMLMSKPNAKLEEFHGIGIITHDPMHVAVFTERRIKPSYYYVFKESKNRKNWISKIKQVELDSIEHRKQYLVKCEKQKEQFQPQKILYASWGWEQTNIDFYLILERNGQTVVLQEIGQLKKLGHHNDRGECMPNPDVKIGDPFKKRITQSAIIRIESFIHAAPFDGKPKYWSSYA